MTTKCGIILFNKETQKYCLVFGKKSKKWGFPKGHQEENEDDEMTAKREFTEETGFELKDTVSLKRKFYVKNNVYFEVFIPDDSHLIKKHNMIPDSNEIEEYRWLSVEEIYDLDISRCNFGLKNWILKKRHFRFLR